MANNNQLQNIEAKYNPETGKLTLEIDMSKYRDFSLTSDMLTEAGNSYRIASTKARWARLDEVAPGLMIRADVIVSKKEYDKRKQHQEQKAFVSGALREIEKNKQAVEVLQNLGISTDGLAEALAMLLAQKQAQKAE